MMTMIFLSEAVAKLQTSLPMASERKAAGDVHRLWLIAFICLFGPSCFATLNFCPFRCNSPFSVVAHSLPCRCLSAGAWGPRDCVDISRTCPYSSCAKGGPVRRCLGVLPHERAANLPASRYCPAPGGRVVRDLAMCCRGSSCACRRRGCTI